MGRKVQVIRAVVSLVFSVLVILFLYGYLTKDNSITGKALEILS